jgi:hypothetical protein
MDIALLLVQSLVEGCEGKFAYNQRSLEIPEPEQRGLDKIPRIDDSRGY